MIHWHYRCNSTSGFRDGYRVQKHSSVLFFCDNGLNVIFSSFLSFDVYVKFQKLVTCLSIISFLKCELASAL